MNWVATFKTGHLSTEECSGRPTQVNSMTMDDQRITNKKIAETLAISQERVGYIFSRF
jgi:hypothetical protein